jgi:hypothetical protein
MVLEWTREPGIFRVPSGDGFLIFSFLKCWDAGPEVGLSEENGCGNYIGIGSG